MLDLLAMYEVVTAVGLLFCKESSRFKHIHFVLIVYDISLLLNWEIFRYSGVALIRVSLIVCLCTRGKRRSLYRP
jgi:hypothetical protein